MATQISIFVLWMLPGPRHEGTCLGLPSSRFRGCEVPEDSALRPSPEGLERCGLPALHRVMVLVFQRRGSVIPVLLLVQMETWAGGNMRQGGV